MEFGNNRPIYLQIVDYMCENILQRKWSPGDKIPSMRDLAVALEVNPNTVMRSYAFLQERNIIYNQRGIGYFVAENGYELTLQLQRQEFMEKEAPRLVKMMMLLGIELQELQELFANLKKEMKNENQ